MTAWDQIDRLEQEIQCAEAKAIRLSAAILELKQKLQRLLDCAIIGDAVGLKNDDIEL